MLDDHFRKTANINVKNYQFKLSVKDIKGHVENSKYQNFQFDKSFTRLALNIAQRVYYSEC
jgi:hypothetical protein